MTVQEAARQLEVSPGSVYLLRFLLLMAWSQGYFLR